MKVLEKAAENLERLRKENPLVLNITNVVVTNLTANALLSIGASPVMAYEKNEIEDMVSISKSLVINIGTLTEDVVETMFKAIKKANTCNVPVIFDPVGAGATNYRNETAKSIINNFKVDVVRGNASEIANLAGVSIATKGVDSVGSVDNILELAKALAGKHDCTVCVSGATDIITDSKTAYGVKNGNVMLTRITGSGCMSTAVMGAFMAIDKNYISACVTGALAVGISGEKAGEAADALGMGSFQVKLFDSLSMMNKTYIKSAKLAIL